jgi:hypothetical protein
MANLATSLRIISVPTGSSQHGHERVERRELPSLQAGWCQGGEGLQLFGRVGAQVGMEVLLGAICAVDKLDYAE